MVQDFSEYLWHSLSPWARRYQLGLTDCLRRGTGHRSPYRQRAAAIRMIRPDSGDPARGERAGCLDMRATARLDPSHVNSYCT
jgi:hypothetical protein